MFCVGGFDGAKGYVSGMGKSTAGSPSAFINATRLSAFRLELHLVAVFDDYTKIHFGDIFKH